MDETKDTQPESNWTAYYQARAGRPPHPLLLDALSRFGTEYAAGTNREAIDLGCGDGTETLTLLENGWQVLAVDSEAASMDYVRSKVPVGLEHRLKTLNAAFEGLRLPAADFIFAGFSLPFCSPAGWGPLWSSIEASVRPGGRFAAHLFGVNDSWASNQDMNFHSRQQLETLLSDSWEIELLQAEEKNGVAFSGPKHWHLFHVIARRSRP